MNNPTQNQRGNSELKPCPFCGGDAELHEKNGFMPTAGFALYTRFPQDTDRHSYDTILYTPRCAKEGCIGRNTKYFYNKEAAITAWNRKVTDERAE